MAKHLGRVHSIEDESDNSEIHPTLNMLESVKLVCPGKMIPLEQKKLDRFLAKLVSSTTIPKSIVENPEFENFVLALNPNYRVPCRKSLDVLISNLYAEIKSKMIDMIRGAEFVSISTDFWSYRGVGIYGLMLTYFDKEASKKGIFCFLCNM